ncbi:hypothetical protein PMI40_03221 [Herbaspirillum sp. YR522]|nr:hypothetical protein PMI40_03221 [Herbaspirillum sp. YR522]
MRHLLFSTESPTNSTFSLEWSKVPALAEKKSVVRLIESLLPIWPAPFVSVSEARYEAIHKVFDDRPGVGWMLYLPRTINTQQVPEAQELIAVHDKDGGQQGTIIVSIRDEPFSVDNEEHIKVAASIEMRLVEHDLLPRYSDL